MENESKWEELKRLFSWWKSYNYSFSWFFRNFVNLIDDPVDNLKHWLNGRKFLWWTIRLPMHDDDDSK